MWPWIFRRQGAWWRPLSKDGVLEDLPLQCKKKISNCLWERTKKLQKNKRRIKKNFPWEIKTWTLLDVVQNSNAYYLYDMKNLNCNLGVKSGPTVIKHETWGKQAQNHPGRILLQHRACRNFLGECALGRTQQWRWAHNGKWRYALIHHERKCTPQSQETEYPRACVKQFDSLKYIGLKWLKR